MTGRIRTLLLAVLILTLSAPPALAQEGPTFGLSAEDWELLSGVPEAMSYVFSAAFTFDGALEISDPATGDQASTGFEGSGEWRAGSIHVMVSTHAVDGTSVDLEYYIIHGSTYFRTRTADWGWTDWVLNTPAAVTMTMLENNILFLPELVFTPFDVANVSSSLEPFADFDVESFLSIERGEDEDGLAVFDYSVDVPRLLTDPEAPDVLGGFLRGVMMAGAMTGQGMPMSSRQIVMLLAMLLREVDTVGQIKVGLQDNYLYAFEFRSEGTMNAVFLDALSSGEMPDTNSEEEEEFSLHYSIEYSDHNGSFNIEPPF